MSHNQDAKLLAGKQAYEVRDFVTRMHKAGYKTLRAKDVRALVEEFNNSTRDIEAAVAARFEKTEIK